jgi:hypothetical protein
VGCIAEIRAVNHSDSLVAVAYAAPVAPQGATIKRAACQAGGCRDAVDVSSVSASMRIA